MHLHRVERDFGQDNVIASVSWRFEREMRIPETSRRECEHVSTLISLESSCIERLVPVSLKHGARHLVQLAASFSWTVMFTFVSERVKRHTFQIREYRRESVVEHMCESLFAAAGISECPRWKPPIRFDSHHLGMRTRCPSS